MQRDSWVSLLARNLIRPCLGREPKARVATTQQFANLEIGNPTPNKQSTN